MKENSTEFDQLIKKFKEEESIYTTDFWDEMGDKASFRPTIYIGLGGFGCNTLRDLKKSIQDLIPDEGVLQGFGFIGIDSHTQEKNDILTANEYIGITGITPHIVANRPDNKPYLQWYNSLAGDWKSTSLISGCNMVRLLGRIAFTYPPTLNRFHNTLEETYNKVNSFIDAFAIAATPKIYIICNAAGGTGSGMFLDVSVVTRHFLNKKGVKENSLQAIIGTPETLEGTAPAVHMPDFYSNTYSLLKEIYNLNAGELERVKVSYKLAGYDDIIVDNTMMPSSIMLISGHNSKGRIVFKTFSSLRKLAVSYLLFEINTPTDKSEGDVKVQDKENDHSDVSGDGNMVRLFSSIGSVRFGIPTETIREYYSQLIIYNALEKEHASSNMVEEVNKYIFENKLSEASSDQLQEEIRKGEDNKTLLITIDIFPELEDVKRTEIEGKCKSIAKEQRNRLKRDKYGLLEQNAHDIVKNTIKNLGEKVEEICNIKSVASAISFIEDIHETIKFHQESLINETNTGKEILSKTQEKTSQSIEFVALAAKSGLFGRKKRIELAANSFEKDLQVEINQQIVVWSMEEGLKIYNTLITEINKLHGVWVSVRKKMTERKSYVTKKAHGNRKKIEHLSDITHRGDGNRFSIIKINEVDDLFKKQFGSEVANNIAGELCDKWKENNTIKDMVTADEIWYEENVKETNEKIKSKLQDLNLISILKTYYSKEEEKKKLFENITALGSPLFPLDNDALEPSGYTNYWVIAVNAEIRDEFFKLSKSFYDVGAGKSFAIFPSKDEVIIYSITHGFTPQSLTLMHRYISNYATILEKYRKNSKHRPVHAWPEAYLWDELIPSLREEESIRKWFALGRAFSNLFPSEMKEDGSPNIDKNDAFIYNRGNFYYLKYFKEHRMRTIKLGNGLEKALVEFGENEEYQEYIKELVEKTINDKGRDLIKRRIEEDYLPVLEDEAERSKNSKERQRTNAIEEFIVEIRRFVRTELISRSI